MTSILLVIDQPFRGVLERQFADAVHLARVGTLQFAAVSVLLTGEGVLLAAPDEASSSDTPAALRAAAGAGAPVLVDRGSAAAYGVQDCVREPYRVVDSAEVAHAFTAHDHVWHI